MQRGIILLLFSSLVISENIEGQNNNKKGIVSGYVTDVNNQPVAGAIILADRKQTGVVTNKKGFYKVRITPYTRMIGACSDVRGSDASIYGTRAAGGVILIDLKGVSDRLWRRIASMQTKPRKQDFIMIPL